jgi:hypothetical protein
MVHSLEFDGALQIELRRAGDSYATALKPAAKFSTAFAQLPRAQGRFSKASGPVGHKSAMD